MGHCHIHGSYQEGLFGDDGCPRCREIEERAERDREKQQEAEERDRIERREAEDRADKYRAERREAEERDRAERREAEERDRAERREAEERKEANRYYDELEERRKEYKRDNPGDYECPACLYITLLRGASRCPHCQATVPSNYWPPIYEQERIEAEERERQERLAAEEWARGEPERRRKAKAEAEEREHAEQLERENREQSERLETETVTRLSRSKSFAQFYFGYLLPISCLLTGLLIGYLKHPERFGPADEPVWAAIFLFSPVLNWLLFLGLLFGANDANDRLLAWILLFMWSFVGGVIYLKIRRR